MVNQSHIYWEYFNMALSKVFVFGIVLSLLCAPCTGRKAVVFIHGLSGSWKDGLMIKEVVQKFHPDTPFYTLDIFNGIWSFIPMWEQVQSFNREIQSIMLKHNEGIHLVCYSQGGLICRGILSTIKHNVDTFVAVSSPLAGQYGDISSLRKIFPDLSVKSEAYKFFYTNLGQYFSVGNYWNDPRQVELYNKFSAFLAPLNNDSTSPNISEYKRNFIRLNKLVLIGGPDDGTISPWESSQFAFYDSSERVQKMESQTFFIKDSFGLKTLYEQKKITVYEISGVKHRMWVRNETVIKSVMLPWLT